ncbi:MAG: guanylate kinase [Deltaproteobacteria bacterium HGW-Deltaproteobacteria-1]|nr:MAG: guanylate kinase [Deltaproteobacteria bacterium HGW-Deltaproteobacteria-1]
MAKLIRSIVVSAPSGTGKSTICRRLLAACPDIKFSVSLTSRTPRPNEINGKDYHFISHEDFQRRIDEGEFVEWVENYGQFYGTSVKVINDALNHGKDLLLDIEPRGAKAIKKQFPDAVFVFVLPPSPDELLKRLKKRGHESEEAIKIRFSQSNSELKEVLWYDYTIFNEDLETAVFQMISIYHAEKCKTNRLCGKIDRVFKI